MGTLPLIDRPTPILDVLKERQTIFLEKPLITLLDGELPSRGTGLLTGRAGERRAGKSRTLRERFERHKRLSK